MSEPRRGEPTLEEEALLLGLRSARDPAAIPRLAALFQGPFDGAGLVRLALEHGVLPLLQRNLEALGELVPAPVARLLAENARRCAWRGLQLTGELVELLELFAARGIQALPYKGPALAAGAYGGVDRRQFGDLDLLLDRRDVLRAKEVLSDRGYRPQRQLDAAQERAYLAKRYAYSFGREEDRMWVELHWRVLPRHFRPRLDFDVLWRRAGKETIGGRQVRAPSLEDHLLVLCLHAAKHRWQLLLWLCDVAELLDRRRAELDWRQIARRARRQGAERRLLVTLLLAREHLAVEIPDRLTARIAADPAARRAAESVGCIVPRTPEATDRFGVDRLQLGLLERFRDRACFLSPYLRRRLRPTARDRAWLPLPRPLRFLQVLVRPIRLLWDHGLRPLASLLRGFQGR